MKAAVRTALLGLTLCLGAGCASVPADPAARAAFKANDDPIEPLNRRIFAFNFSVDRALIKPLAQGYRRALPRPVRDALRHFLDNLNEPIVLGNCLLQGRIKPAGIAGGRFVVNSTVGVAGFFEVAGSWKMPPQFGDFGQTLWVWGVADGPYLIVPVFGPSTPRDGIGLGVDVVFDPLRYIPRHQNYPTSFTVGRIVVDGIDRRSRSLDALDEIQRESLDFYAAFRSLYRQNRAAELSGAKAVAPPLAPADLYDDPGR